MSDYISREAAKMAVVEATNKCYSPYNAIVMLPSADVVERDLYDGAEARCDNFESALKDLVKERKTGRWIDKWIEDDELIGGGYPMIECSVCHEEEPYKSNFCPSCGARMVNYEV